MGPAARDTMETRCCLFCHVAVTMSRRCRGPRLSACSSWRRLSRVTPARSACAPALQVARSPPVAGRAHDTLTGPHRRGIDVAQLTQTIECVNVAGRCYKGGRHHSRPVLSAARQQLQHLDRVCEHFQHHHRRGTHSSAANRTSSATNSSHTRMVLSSDPLATRARVQFH